jgi:hypothetical protein
MSAAYLCFVLVLECSKSQIEDEDEGRGRNPSRRPGGGEDRLLASRIANRIGAPWERGASEMYVKTHIVFLTQLETVCYIAHMLKQLLEPRDAVMAPWIELEPR